MTAWVKASGASWGRLCPTPPSMVRCEYLPENLPAQELGSGCGAPLASPSRVIVGTVMTGPLGEPLLQVVIFRVAFRESKAPAVVVDHDLDVVVLSNDAALRANVASKFHVGEAVRQMSSRSAPAPSSTGSWTQRPGRRQAGVVRRQQASRSAHPQAARDLSDRHRRMRAWLPQPARTAGPAYGPTVSSSAARSRRAEASSEAATST
jgi:hypothetical protein